MGRESLRYLNNRKHKQFIDNRGLKKLGPLLFVIALHGEIKSNSYRVIIQPPIPGGILDLKLAKKIIENENYQRLVKTRSRYSWLMTALVVFVYFGFIYLVAFGKEFLAQPISSDSVITVSIPIGLGVIAFTVILTGIYVRRANSEFDALNEKVKGDL